MRAATVVARGLVALAVLVVMFVPGQHRAFAHDDDRVDTTPAANETVQSVEAIVADFAGPVDGERFEVIDPSGARVEGTTSVTNDGVATFDPAAVVTEAGEYTVRYVARSADGHLLSGEFTFTVGADQQGGGRALRWAAGAGAVIATFSIASATILRRRRTHEPP